ncbi:hypothetical protein SAMN04490185_2551 [Pseudomonas frederiksbergensis]|uniref:Uncharacterized protein n=1 Tax=Pseudomonas frederiksbergensis TaxID=104087 RepID=A0A1H4X4U8_9PSED|nr:hypothetical protein SAMN04490185_2551 [Pseudomonas frederiksbergensis]
MFIFQRKAEHFQTIFEKIESYINLIPKNKMKPTGSQHPTIAHIYIMIKLHSLIDNGNDGHILPNHYAIIKTNTTLFKIF